MSGKVRKNDQFMELARQNARIFSKDTSTKVGCIIVGSQNEILTTGYNGMPRGVNDDVETRYQRPTKYLWFEHAERNAIFNAARIGVSLLGSRAYVTSLCPCPDCARALIQSGIHHLYLESAAFDVEKTPRAAAWLEDWDKVTKEMLMEAGLMITLLD